MKTAKVNVFRDGNTWCQSTWIDEAFDSSDPIGIGSDATEEEAMEAAKASLAGRFVIEVFRVGDIDSSAGCRSR